MDILQTSIACAAEHWEWRIGDPEPIAWAIVAIYLLAAAGAIRAAAVASLRRERLFWWTAALVALALALNKQLDLQAFVTGVGRCTAKLGGWYDRRREVQAMVFAVLVLWCLAGGAVLAWALRRSLGRLWPALLGLMLMGSFVLLRAISLTHFDTLLRVEVGTVKLNWLIEMTGPLVVATGAWFAARSQRNRRPLRSGSSAR